DADGDPLIFHTSTGPSHGILNLNTPNGQFTYTPNTGFSGTDTFTFIVNDGTQDSTPATVTITVGSGQGNTAPVADSATFNTATGVAVSGTLTASDADNDPLTFSAVDVPTHGSLNITTAGDFTYTPSLGFSGTDTFTFKVNDGTVD